MPSFLEVNRIATESITVYELLLRLAMSVLFGGFIAWVYNVGHGSEKGKERWAMISTLILLCIFIAMVSLVIGDSVAKAFSLVGALSIVRFRTVVEDTRDTAFVIFSVIAGMAVGSGYFLVPFLGVPLASGVAIAIHRFGLSRAKNSGKSKVNCYSLTLKVHAGQDPLQILQNVLTKFVLKHRIASVSTGKQGTLIEVVCKMYTAPEFDAIATVSLLNRTEGVQSAELKLCNS